MITHDNVLLTSSNAMINYFTEKVEGRYHPRNKVIVGKIDHGRFVAYVARRLPEDEGELLNKVLYTDRILPMSLACVLKKLVVIEVDTRFPISRMTLEDLRNSKVRMVEYHVRRKIE